MFTPTSARAIAPKSSAGALRITKLIFLSLRTLRERASMVCRVSALLKRYNSLDAEITKRMAEVGIPALRFSLGIIFLWFGFLKFFPGMSSAEDLALRTTRILTYGSMPDWILLWTLATWECAIGIGLILRFSLRTVLLLLWMQMAGTLLPLIFFRNETFAVIPWVPTLEGQYIIKNLVIISAALVVGATVRGGGLVSDKSQTTKRKLNN